MHSKEKLPRSWNHQFAHAPTPAVAQPRYIIPVAMQKTAGTVGWSKTMIEIPEVQVLPESGFFSRAATHSQLGNLWPGTRGTWMRLMGSFMALVPVVVILIPSPPPLGAASAAMVYRVLAAVVSSLRERTR